MTAPNPTAILEALEAVCALSDDLGDALGRLAFVRSDPKVYGTLRDRAYRISEAVLQIMEDLAGHSCHGDCSPEDHQFAADAVALEAMEANLD